MKLRNGKLIGSVLVICSISFFSITHSKEINADTKKPELKFNSNGTFKIVQFADAHEGPIMDTKTIDLMNKILDYEKPNLVVLTGDNIDDKCRSAADVKKAINNLANPMEKRRIPWAVVFGNHDTENDKVGKEAMLRLYMSYPHNISQAGFRDADRIGNYTLLVKSSKSNLPEFNIYMLDSGTYSSLLQTYDWIKKNQIAWYRNTSAELKAKYGSPIPSLMFFHIPLPEWKELWNSGTAIGERNEEVSCSYINSGLFQELVRTGDVKGVFVGHDHINDYIGNLQGIILGYSRSIGYDTYGKEGFSRGARVFIINENNPSKFRTWMRLEEDF